MKKLIYSIVLIVITSLIVGYIFVKKAEPHSLGDERYSIQWFGFEFLYD